MTQCGDLAETLHMVTAVFVVVNTLLGVWLARRRKTADSEREKFYWQMRQKHGLASSRHEQDAARKGKYL
jgi:hypothetical protein